MTKVDKITLITVAISTDEIGQITKTESSSDVIAEVRSVSRSEFMEGSQTGLAPTFVFRVSMFAYTSQTVVKYKNVKYNIYRTYETDDNYVELYCEREVGVSDG